VIKITQSEIDSMVQELACQIQADDRRFLRVVGIANSGLPVSKPLATILGLPHESVHISHYDNKTRRSVPIVKGRLSQPTDNLIVDDLIDRGWTITTFAKYFGLEGNAVAVLFWNPVGSMPDFYVKEKPAVWLSFPWDKD